MVKEVILFSYGDSNNPATWSNVPFCFSTAMKKKGVIVHSINIEPPRLLNAIWKICFYIPLSVFYPGHQLHFMRTRFFQILAYRKIKKAVTTYKEADYCIFTCYDFYNRFSSIPSLLFSDWTYKILIDERLGRKPYWFEYSFEKIQYSTLSHADKIVCLFPAAAQSMSDSYPKLEVLWRKNVINCLYPKNISETDILSTKLKSKQLLFIGNKWYKAAAQKIVEALHTLKEQGYNIQFNIIGLNNDQIDSKDVDVKCYGYLNKGIPEECNLYYKLLIEARVFCNPTPKWAGYSSMVEAMYFYTPVIVAPNHDLVMEFGEEPEFGIYNHEFNATSIAENIKKIFNEDRYIEVAKKAHGMVCDYTWDNYVDWLFDNM